MDIFDNSDGAFTPFYAEDVQIERKNGERQTVKCVITDDITDDPISDDMLDTRTKRIALTFQKCDWAFIQDVSRGDRLYRPSTRKWYSVDGVDDDFAFGFIIRARETRKAE